MLLQPSAPLSRAPETHGHTSQASETGGASSIALKRAEPAVAGVAQLVWHCPANQKVVGLIPAQATSWVVGSALSQGVCKRQQIKVSVSN